jgi:hypothetical protein
MNEEKTIKLFFELPDTAKSEASDFISYLHNKYKIKGTKTNGKKGKLKFYGIFKDRDDMTDSTTWVRDVRKKHWESR